MGNQSINNHQRPIDAADMDFYTFLGIVRCGNNEEREIEDVEYQEIYSSNDVAPDKDQMLQPL